VSLDNIVRSFHRQEFKTTIIDSRGGHAKSREAESPRGDLIVPINHCKYTISSEVNVISNKSDIDIYI
jgi:hypothetical protein